MRVDPKRVQVGNTWYDVRAGWAGTLELYEYARHPAYTAEEPFAHVSNLFYVYDINKNKVGEFHTVNQVVGGMVNAFE